jgi:hypothetical protein
MTNICQVAGCGKKHEARGYCKRHYKSLGKYGDALQVDRNEKERKKKREEREKREREREKVERWSTEGTCHVEGCDKKIKAKGYCDAHYALWSRTGRLETKNRYNMTTCMMPGCERKHKSKGYCQIHYGNFQVHKSPVKAKKFRLCGVEGCYNSHQARGMCMSHYNEWIKMLREKGLYSSEYFEYND